MSAVSVHPTSGAVGATAAGAAGDHPRHLLGNALRAVRVMVGVAFEVVVLGRVDSRVERRADADAVAGDAGTDADAEGR